MTGFADHFSRAAEAYASARPRYRRTWPATLRYREARGDGPGSPA